jgi:hypothetical protein
MTLLVKWCLTKLGVCVCASIDAKFQFMEQLFVIHGHWCYKCITLMVLTSFHFAIFHESSKR